MILDYELGNVKGIQNILIFDKINVKISRDVDEISNCDKLILPGVGAYGVAMKN